MIGEAIQALKRAWGKRRPVFEVRKNAAGNWYVREVAANGQVMSVAEDYSSKSNAKRAAKVMAAESDATWRVV